MKSRTLLLSLPFLMFTACQSVAQESEKTTETTAPFEQRELPYGYDALSPHIDAETMQIHYSKHHAGYVKKLNNAVKESGDEDKTLKEILSNVSQKPDAVRNNAGGHYNHDLFWTVLSPEGGEPSEELTQAINDSFGSLDKLKSQMNDAASSRFGSGWAWLYVTSAGQLAITSTPNQDNPLMDVAEDRGTPVFGIDVWEHAYYLKYQNQRGEYLSAIWEVTNWEEVSRRYSEAKEELAKN